jgi:hypothetical protein
MAAMRVDERNLSGWAGHRKAAAKIHRFLVMKSPTGVMQCKKFAWLIGLLTPRPGIDPAMHRGIEAMHNAAG